MNGRTLLYIPSDEIVDFVSRNPIDWDNQEYAKRGGIGDRAGVTPTPAVEEFISLLQLKTRLFTQEEYMKHCWEAWREWIFDKPKDQKYGIKAKLYRNFYPSMIDSLHVWAMLCESQMFDACVLSSAEDAIGKTDLIVRSKYLEYRIAIIGPNQKAMDDRQYKVKHRSGSDDKVCIELQMPINYAKSPGNKRWFRRSDVMSVLLNASPEIRVLGNARSN